MMESNMFLKAVQREVDDGFPVVHFQLSIYLRQNQMLHKEESFLCLIYSACARLLRGPCKSALISTVFNSVLLCL